MQITDIKTFLVDATPKGGWGGGGRNWLFVKIETDEGISGIGEASGWPRVIQTAITDLTTILIGEDPCRIERLWQKMLLGMMGHGMTGVVGAGAMTGIEIACWDILGKKLGVPICDLLGGRVRDSVRVYGHAGTAERAQELVARGYTALKCGGPHNPVPAVRRVRRAVGDDIDVCVDVHGPPWFTVPDAIRVGQELEEYDILFYEDPVPLVVEVWSPSTGDYDVEEKLREYQRRGDVEIWRIHPYEHTLTVWRLQTDGNYSETLSRAGQVQLAALPNASIDLDALFPS